MAEPDAYFRCSFCANSSAETVAGPSVYICFSCVAEYNNRLKQSRAATTTEKLTSAPTCSFCGKTAPVDRQLLAGSNAWICDNCLALCNDIRAGR